jgi:hypothetical protein
VVSIQEIIIQLTHIGHRVFMLMEDRTCINPHVPCAPLFSISVITPTLKSSHKPRQLVSTMGLTRSSFMRALAFQSTTKFLPDSRWILGSLLFIANKFGDLKLQEPESREVVGSSTGRLPPAPVQVDLINEARLGHRLVKLGKTDLDPSGDKADHSSAISVAIT